MRELLSKCLISGQINSFLYACVSVPPSSLQHSRAKLLFLLLKLFCWSGPLLLLMLLPLLWLEGFRGLHGEFRLRTLTSRLTENARERKKRGGGGTEEMQSFSEWRRRRETDRAHSPSERASIVWSSTRRLPPALYDSTAFCWCIPSLSFFWIDERMNRCEWVRKRWWVEKEWGQNLGPNIVGEKKKSTGEGGVTR